MESDASELESFVHRFESAVVDPFFKASRKVPFFSADLMIGFALLGIAALPVFLVGGFSVPAAEDEVLVGWRERF